MAIVIYIVAGILIMKFRYQATGTDIIPNKEFWLSFPLLIKVAAYTSYHEFSTASRKIIMVYK